MQLLRPSLTPLGQLLQVIGSAIFLLGSSSCAVVVGNVKPVDEKSTQYGVMDLTQNNPDWQKLDPAKTGQDDDAHVTDVSPTEVSDVAYQSKTTASVISVDSACRSNEAQRGFDLQTLTNMLFLGITDVTLREEVNMDLQKIPALQTTLQGKLNGEPIMFQTIVMKRSACVYDFVYMARPQYFPQHQDDFAHFVASLRLKE